MPQIQHPLIPDSANHPWRFADYEQEDNALYVADGYGSGDWCAMGANVITWNGSHVVSINGSADWKRFTPTAPFVDVSLTPYVTAGADSLTWYSDHAGVLQINYSITLSHSTTAANQLIQAAVAITSAVAGYEWLTVGSTRAKDKSCVLSGQLIAYVYPDDVFGIWLKGTASEDLTVTRATLSMQRLS